MSQQKILLISILALLIVTTISLYVYNNLSLSLSPSDPDNVQQKKEIEITINTDGTSKEKIKWEIQVKDVLIYFPIGEWGIQIPKTAESIKIYEKDKPLEFKREETAKEHSIISFQNTEQIKQESNHVFEISYEVAKNPIIIEPFATYQRTITRFDTDDQFELTIKLPEQTILHHINPSATQNNPLTFALEKGQTQTIELELEFPELKPDIAQIHSQFYTMLLPSRYAEEYTNVLKKADQGFTALQKLYDFAPNSPLDIAIIRLEDADFEEHVGAYYLGDGKIRIKQTNLLRTEEKTINTIMHETVHAFNAEYFSETLTNNWIDEGSATFYAEYLTEQLGFDQTQQKTQVEKILDQCANVDKTFISSWRPNLHLRDGEEQEINCQGISLSPIDLGYAQSYTIVKTLVEKYGINIMQQFFKEAQKNNMQFSSDHNEFNKQINQLLSQTLNEDTTELLQSQGIQLDDANQNSQITGFQILENEETKKEKTLLVILIIALATLIILAVKTFENKQKAKTHTQNNSPYYKFKNNASTEKINY